MPQRDLPWWRLAAVALLGAAVGVVILTVRDAQRVPDDVQPIAWNRQACGHCRMLIGEPRHAAQLITLDGDVLSFDDPGCALRYLADHRPAIHRLWFHHARDDRWLAAGDVAFLTGTTTPMASGLAAIDRGTPGAIDLAAARAVVTPGAPP
jgi:hypothetical protein